MVANPKRRYTLEEYFELERNSEERFEFWNGEVFCMSGGSRAHELIIRNLLVSLTLKLRGRNCEAFTSNTRIKVPSAPPYRYPDLTASCDTAEFEKIGGIDALTNPVLIIEVLSSSTESYDRGEKFAHYKSIPSFGEYLLIAQYRPFVTQFIKHDERTWLQREYNDLDAEFILSSLVCELSLREIYENVEFDSSQAPRDERMSVEEFEQ